MTRRHKATADAAADSVEVMLILAAATCPALWLRPAAHPFEPHQAFFFWFAAAALGAVLALSPSLWKTPSMIAAWRTPLVVVLALGVLATIVATASGAAPALAWWGSPLRRHGALTQLCAALFVVASLAIGRRVRAERLISAVLLGSVVPTVYGISQFAGLDPFAPAVVAGSRPTATLGNPLFLAGYLIVVVPLTCARLVTIAATHSRSWRTPAIGVLLVLQCVVLAGTRSVGPMLALGGAVAVVAAIVTSQRASRGTTRVVAFGIVTAAIVFAIVVPERLRAFETISPESGAPSVMRTMTVRWLLWDSIGRSLAAEPRTLVFGSGPESTTRLTTTHGGARLQGFEGLDTAPDRAHNAALETIASSGVVGFVLLLASCSIAVLISMDRASPRTMSSLKACVAWSFVVATVSGVMLWRGNGLWAIALVTPPVMALLCGLLMLAGGRNGATRSLGAVDAMPLGLTAAFVGHVLEGQTGVPTIASALTASVVLGLLAAVTIERSEAERAESAKPVRDGGRVMWVLAAWLAGVAAVPLLTATFAAERIVAAIYVVSMVAAVAMYRAIREPGQPALKGRTAVGAVLSLAIAGTIAVRFSAADVLSAVAANGMRESQLAVALRAQQQAAAYDPWNVAIQTQLGDFHIARAESDPGVSFDAEFAAARAAFDRAVVLDPYDYHHHRNRAAINRRWARSSPSSRDQRLAEADGFYQAAIRLSPENGGLYAEWANLDAERGRLSDAFVKLERAAAFGVVTTARTLSDALLRLEGFERQTDTAAAAWLRARGYEQLARLYERPPT